MVLLAAVLTDEVLKITDKTRPDFVGFPAVVVDGVLDVAATNELVASNWANAAGNFFLGMTVPPGAVLGVPLAVLAFKATMLGLLSVPGGGVAALEQAFFSMGPVLAAASVPVAVPPPAPPPIGAALAPFLAGTADPTGPALALANAVFLWTKTGLWGPPPAPPSSPWA
jgi:hypothetical protein